MLKEMHGNEKIQYQSKDSGYLWSAGLREKTSNTAGKSNRGFKLYW